MPINIRNFELNKLWGFNKIRSLKLSAKIFVIFAIIDIAGLLVCNIRGLPILGFNEPSDPVPLWPLRWVAYLFTAYTAILVWIAWGVADIGQELLPKKWVTEVETAVAVKRTIAFMSADIGALAVAYFFDPRTNPPAYTALVLISIMLLITHQSGSKKKG